MEQLREPINNFIYNWQPKGNADHAQEYFKSELFEMLETAMRDAYTHGTMDTEECMSFPNYFAQIKEKLNK